MPMYDFRCTKCRHEFEDIIAATDQPPVCTECGAPTERLVSRLNMGKRDKPSTPKADYYRNKGYNEEKNRYPTKK